MDRLPLVPSPLIDLLTSDPPRLATALRLEAELRHQVSLATAACMRQRPGGLHRSWSNAHPPSQAPPLLTSHPTHVIIVAAQRDRRLAT